MRIGVVFPQTEIGSDPVVIRDYAQAVEELGYQHILAFDHVLGASTTTRPDWRGAYTTAHLFHEPFVLFSYLAAITKNVELVTGVIILPQRQTVLVAKQAAKVDVLSGGRLRLGIGVGWNAVEYEGLNENFHDRGIRSEEQIVVLRALWAEPEVTFRGRWHTIDAAGINPLPVRRSIPIWIGGHDERALRRIGRIGDGWFPLRRPNETRAMLDRVQGYAREAGRDPASIGVEGRLNIGQVEEAMWVAEVEAWRELGASHLSVNTMGANLPSPNAHIEALHRVKDVIGN